MTKRPNLLVILGAALFLVGGAIVFLVVHNDDRSSETSASRQLVPVVVATANLTAGESGDAVLASGDVVVRQVPLDQRSTDALSASTVLSGQTISAAVSSGSQVPLTALSPPNLRSSSIQIPAGKQAVAVTVDFTAGVAGYAAAGDRVNVYTMVAPGAPNATPATVPSPTARPTLPATPYTKLLLSDVQVLDVSDEVAPRVTAASADTTDTDVSGQQRATSATLTLLLALTAQQAEQVIFATNVNELYFTVLPKGQGPSTTKGVGYGLNYPVPATPGAGK